MRLFSLIFLCVFFGCSASKLSISEELQQRFEKGISLFESEKFMRAKDEFLFIVSNNPGTQMALDAQFLLAESYFSLKEYENALQEYDYFARFSQDYNKVEQARFRICECAILSSNSFEKDQENSKLALDRLQEFIEDYPNSQYAKKANIEMDQIRYKLARKSLESARLYLKLEEYDSALIYLNNILSEYYDTSITDDARITIIFAYLLQNKHELAHSFYKNNERNFISLDKSKEAIQLIENMKSGMGLSEYLRLYK